MGHRIIQENRAADGLCAALQIVQGQLVRRRSRRRVHLFRIVAPGIAIQDEAIFAGDGIPVRAEGQRGARRELVARIGDQLQLQIGHKYDRIHRALHGGVVIQGRHAVYFTGGQRNRHSSPNRNYEFRNGQRLARADGRGQTMHIPLIAAGRFSGRQLGGQGAADRHFEVFVSGAAQLLAVVLDSQLRLAEKFHALDVEGDLGVPGDFCAFGIRPGVGSDLPFELGQQVLAQQQAVRAAVQSAIDVHVDIELAVRFHIDDAAAAFVGIPGRDGAFDSQPAARTEHDRTTGDGAARLDLKICAISRQRDCTVSHAASDVGCTGIIDRNRTVYDRGVLSHIQKRRRIS